jgi:hypothetical protein
LRNSHTCLFLEEHPQSNARTFRFAFAAARHCTTLSPYDISFIRPEKSLVDSAVRPRSTRDAASRLPSNPARHPLS